MLYTILGKAKASFLATALVLFLHLPVCGHADPLIQEGNREVIAQNVIEAESLLSENPDSAIAVLDPLMLELKAPKHDSLLARAYYVREPPTILKTTST